MTFLPPEMPLFPQPFEVDRVTFGVSAVDREFQAIGPAPSTLVSHVGRRLYLL